MANIRNLKKDVDYVVYELLSDCATYQMMNSGQKAEQVGELMNGAFQIRQDLFNKINNPSIPEGKKAKAFYKEIYIELLKRADDSFKKLSEIVK
ncbi:MAG: hypothetical protein A2W91_10680 [Bacteroidetes bacterium GWF2_38_335]|nr:MAG: hypothetical protein A2W91_10680 [Bacteroidetes bacterium GWF2_38_335]OFY81833.1 MAG: hypothetical protein A2281_06360 [Bacteroidetes bacterium RIFOXYA12_FULL_38_20]HBS87906.1 hypothetical protein [Bacteroidales bacterium]